MYFIRVSLCWEALDTIVKHFDSLRFGANHEEVAKAFIKAFEEEDTREMYDIAKCVIESRRLENRQWHETDDEAHVVICFDHVSLWSESNVEIFLDRTENTITVNFNRDSKYLASKIASALDWAEDLYVEASPTDGWLAVEGYRALNGHLF